MSIRNQLKRFARLQSPKANPASTTLGTAISYGALIGLASSQSQKSNIGQQLDQSKTTPLQKTSIENVRASTELAYDQAVFGLSSEAADIVSRLNHQVSVQFIQEFESSHYLKQVRQDEPLWADRDNVVSFNNAQSSLLEQTFKLQGTELDVLDLSLSGDTTLGNIPAQVNADNSLTGWSTSQVPNQALGPESLWNDYFLESQPEQHFFKAEEQPSLIALLSPENPLSHPKTKGSSEEPPEETVSNKDNESGANGTADFFDIDLDNPLGFEVALDMPDFNIAAVDPDSISLEGFLPAAAGGGGGGGGVSFDSGVASDAGGAGAPDVNVSTGVGAPSGGTATTPSGPAATTPFNGRVVDGAVQFAQVFVDYNGNSILDADEPFTETDADGFYSFASDVDPTLGNIISIGGTDVETDIVMGTLKAEAGSQYVTPISTLYVTAEQLSEGSGAQLLEALQLSSNDLTYDPIESSEANSLNVLKTGASLVSMVSNAASLTTRFTGETESEAAESIFRVIAESRDDLGVLFGQDAESAATKFQNVLTLSMENAGVNIEEDLDEDDMSIIEKAATYTAARTAEIAKTSVKSAASLSEMYADAKFALQNVKSKMSELVTLKQSDPTAFADALNSLDQEFNQTAVDKMKALVRIKNAVKEENIFNGILASVDLPSIDPESDVTFNVLLNDKTTKFSKSNLELLSVQYLNLDTESALSASVSDFSLTDNTITINALGDINDWNVLTNQSGSSLLFVDVVSGEDVYTAQVLSLKDSAPDSNKKLISLRDLPNDFDFSEATLTLMNLAGTLPDELTLGHDSKGDVTFELSDSIDPELKTYDFFYLAGDSQNTALMGTGFISLNISPSAPSVSLIDRQVNEDDQGTLGYTSVSLPLTVALEDLGQSGSVSIYSEGKGELPDGVQLYFNNVYQDPKTKPREYWNLTTTVLQDGVTKTDQINGLEFRIPEHFSGNLSFEVVATKVRSGYAPVNSDSVAFSVVVVPMADGLGDLTASNAELTALNLLSTTSEGFKGELLFDPSNLEEAENGNAGSPYLDFINELRQAIIDSDQQTPEYLAVKVTVDRLNSGDDELSEVPNSSIKIESAIKDGFLGEVSGYTAILFDDPNSKIQHKLEDILGGLSFSTTESSKDFSGSVTIRIEVGSFEGSEFSQRVGASTQIQDAGNVWDDIVASKPLVERSFTVNPVSDVPILKAMELVLGQDSKGAIETLWSQSNHKLSDGRYATQIEFDAQQTDNDNSENLFIDVLRYDLTRSGSALDLGGSTTVTTVVENDNDGRSLLFTAASGTLTGSSKAFIENVNTGGVVEARVTFADLAAGKSVSLGGVTLIAANAMTGHEVADFFRTESITGWTAQSDFKSIWRRFDASDSNGSFSVVSPSTISKELTIHARAVSQDGAASTAASGVQAFTIPFQETPKVPALTVIPSLNVPEDNASNPFFGQDFVLSKLIKVEPAVGRTLDSISLYIELGNVGSADPALTLALKDSSNGWRNLSPIGASVAGLSGNVFKVSAVDLASVAIRSTSHLQSTVELRVVAEDIVASGASARSSAAPSSGPAELIIVPVADGIVTNIDPGVLSMSIGVESSIDSWFSKVALIDTNESFNAKLIFKDVTSSGSVLMKSNGAVLLPTVIQNGSKVNLTFNLSQDQIEAGNLKLTVKADVAGKDVELVASSIDGIDVSSTTTQLLNLTISGDAVQPDGALFNVSGLEDSQILIPSNISINPDRVGFEKIGIRAIVTDSNVAQDVRTAVFGIKGAGPTVDGHPTDLLFSADVNGVWDIFRDTGSQIDLSQLFFQAPPNFSGNIPFQLTPYSQTSIGNPVYANSSDITVGVEAVAEIPTFAVSDRDIVLTGTENTKINLPLSSMLDWVTLTDFDETVNLGLKLSSNIALEKDGVNGFKAVSPVSVQSGIASYTISVPVNSWQSSLEGMYRLSPSLNYASADPSNYSSSDYAYTIAQGLGISVNATSIESTGAFKQVVSPLLVDLVINPVASNAPSLNYAQAGVTSVSLQEHSSSQQANDSFSPYSLVRLSSSVLQDASESLAVRVMVQADDRDQLSFYSTNDESVYDLRAASNGLSDYWEVVNGAGTLLTAQEYQSLGVRGAEFEYGSFSIDIQSVVTESWGVSRTESAAKSIEINVAARANSFSTSPALSGESVVVSEDAKQFADVNKLSDLISSGVTLDSAELVRYLVSIPSSRPSTGESLAALQWAGSGSAPALAAPSASIEGEIRYLTYDIAAEDMNLYTLRGEKNVSGDFTIKFKAYTQVDGQPNVVSGPLTIGNGLLSITPVADPPTVVAPSQVSGLISDSTDSSQALIVPVKIYKNDSNEELAVDLFVKNISSPDDVTLKIRDVSLTSSGPDDTYGGYKFSVDPSEINNLSELTIISSKDYRNTSAIELVVAATSTDGASTSKPVVQSTMVTLYQSLDQYSISLNDPVVDVYSDGVETKVNLFGITLPLHPAGKVSNLVVLVSNVPDTSFFTDEKGQSIGASLGDGLGLWVFRGSDLFNVNGTSKKLILNGLDVWDEYSPGNLVHGDITIEAILSDPDSGSTLSSNTMSISTWTNNYESESLSDPLVLSLSGAPIQGDSVDPAFSFELASEWSGLERPTFWIDNPEGAPNYAFLLKPSVDTTNPTVVPTISDLYVDFDEIGNLLSEAALSDGLVTDAELANALGGQPKLWFDRSDEGQQGTIETEFEILDLASFGYSGFTLALPEPATSPSSGEGLVSFYQAAMTLDKMSGDQDQAMVYAVGIPFRAAADSFELKSFDGSLLTTKPFAFVTAFGTDVPEDQEGAVGFVLNLQPAAVKPDLASVTPLHLFKVYVDLPEGAVLSRGTLFDDGSESFWLMTEDAVGEQITVLGLPEDWFGNLNVSVQAVVTASLFSGGSSTVETVEQPQESLVTTTIRVHGVADTPFIQTSIEEVIDKDSSGHTLTEGGKFSLANHIDLAVESRLNNFLLQEDVYVRFSINAPGGYRLTNVDGTDWIWPSILGYETRFGPTPGQYVVPYFIGETSDKTLDDLYIDFDDFVSGTGSISYELISIQGDSFAASQTIDLLFSIDSVVSPVVNSGSGFVSASVEEGSPLDLHLQAGTIDPNELLIYRITLGGDYASQESIELVTGMVELVGSEKQVALAGKETSNWRVFEYEGEVNSSGSFTGGTYLNNQNSLVYLDPYFDGSLSYELQAKSVDTLSGKEGSFTSLASGSIIISPKADIGQWNASISNSMLVVDKTDGLTSTASISLTQQDPDETGSVRFIIYESAQAFSFDADGNLITSGGGITRYEPSPSSPSSPIAVHDEGAGDYYFEALDNASPNNFYAAVLELEVSDDGQTQAIEYSNLPIFIELPSFAKPIALPDQNGSNEKYLGSKQEGDAITLMQLGLQGFSNAQWATLLSLDEATVSILSMDEIAQKVAAANLQITYTLSNVPDWLIIEGGVLTAQVESGGEIFSEYEFSETAFELATASFERAYSVGSEQATLSLKARNVDLYSFDVEFSEVALYGVTKIPTAETPIVTGPTQKVLLEGDSFDLGNFQILLPGFAQSLDSYTNEEQTLLDDSILVNVSSASNIQLNLDGTSYSLGSLGNAGKDLSMDELSMAQIYTTNPDDVTPFTFTLRAKQTLGDNFKESQAFNVNAVILNQPEDITLSTTFLTLDEVKTLQEGSSEVEGTYVLPNFQIAGSASGEGLLLNLEMPSTFVLRDDQGDAIDPSEIQANRSVYLLYSIDDAQDKLTADGSNNLIVPMPYSIGLPAGVQLGESTISLSAQSFDPTSGSVGTMSEFNFILDVTARADDPEFIVPDRIQAVEDSEEGVLVSFAAFSPDPRESVTLEARLQVNGSAIDPSNWTLESNYLDDFVSDGVNSFWRLSLPAGIYEPIEINLIAPQDFYNASLNIDTDQLDIHDNFELTLRAVSFYDDGADGIYSDPPTASSIPIVVTGINDAPTVDAYDTGNVFGGSLTESNASLSENYIVIDPDRFDNLVFETSPVGVSYGFESPINIIDFSIGFENENFETLGFVASNDVIRNILDPGTGFSVNITQSESGGDWVVDWLLQADSVLGQGSLSKTFDFLAAGEQALMNFTVNVTDRPEDNAEHGGFNNSVQEIIQIVVDGENDLPFFMTPESSESSARLFLGAFSLDPQSGDFQTYTVNNGGISQVVIDDRLIADGTFYLIERDLTDTTYLSSRVESVTLTDSVGDLKDISSLPSVNYFNDLIRLTNDGVIDAQAGPEKNTIDREKRSFEWEFEATSEQYDSWGLSQGDTLTINYEIDLSDSDGGDVVDKQAFTVVITSPDFIIENYVTGQAFLESFAKDNLTLSLGLGANLHDFDVTNAFIETSQKSNNLQDAPIVLLDTKSILIDESGTKKLLSSSLSLETFDLMTMLNDYANYGATKPIDLEFELHLNNSEGVDQIYSDITSFTLLPDVAQILSDAMYESAIFGERFDEANPVPSSNYLDSLVEWAMIDPQFGSQVLSSDSGLDGAEIDGVHLAGTQGEDLVVANERSFATGEGSILFGGAGKDILMGHEGKDILIATSEDGTYDQLIGNYGDDIFLIAKGNLSGVDALNEEMNNALDTLMGPKNWSVLASIEGFSFERAANSDSIAIMNFDSDASVNVQDLGGQFGAAVLIQEDNFVSAILLPDFIGATTDELAAIEASIHKI